MRKISSFFSTLKSFNLFLSFLTFIEKTTFEEFEEIYNQIIINHYNDEKEIIDSNINLLTNLY